MEVLDEVTVLVERELGIALDRESYNYARFAMHIQFLVRRLSSGKVMEQGSGKMLSELSAEYPATYRCAQAVAKRSSSAMAGIAVRTGAVSDVTHLPGTEPSERLIFYLNVSVLRRCARPAGYR